VSRETLSMRFFLRQLLAVAAFLFEWILWGYWTLERTESVSTAARQ
jgi:hypothetical protein